MQLVVDVHPDPALRSLLALRMAQLAPSDGLGLGDAAHFLIFEPGDPDFSPCWEWIELHDGWIEIAYLFSDDGFAAVIFVQRADGVEPDLIALCEEWGGDLPTD